MAVSMNRYLNLIILAAGNSERFGANKLLTSVLGKPMYRHIFDHLVRYGQDHPASCQIIAVSQYDEILDAATAAGVAAVRNSRPEDGISRSIRLGIEAVGKSRSIQVGDPVQRECAVFFTADQPYMRYETLESFLRLAQTTAAGMLSAAHQGISGNPVSFDQAYFPELLALAGDTGGKRVMNAHLDDVEWFEVAPDELMDIDFPAKTNP